MATPIYIGDAANPQRHKCSMCGTRYNRKYNCQRHIDAVHNKETRKLFCKYQCGYKTARSDHLESHYHRGCPAPREGMLPKWACLCCNSWFSNRKQLMAHRRTGEHAQAEFKAKKPRKKPPAKKNVKPRDWMEEDPLSDPIYPDDAPEELRVEYRQKWHIIRQHTICDRPFVKAYIVRLTNGITFDKVLRDLYETADGIPFDVNVEAVPVLHTQQTNPDTGESEHEYDVRYPSENHTIVPRTLIDNPLKLEEALETYKSADLEKIMKVAPSSKWDLCGYASILVRVYPRERLRMIGATQRVFNGVDHDDTDEEKVIRQAIINSKSVRALHDDGHHPQLYVDKLCVFRVLADKLLDENQFPLNPYLMERLHWKQIRRAGEANPRAGLSVRRLTLQLFRQWVENKYPDQDVTTASYIGTRADELWEIEKFFNIRLNVYVLELSQELKDYAKRTRNELHHAIQNLEAAEEANDAEEVNLTDEPPAEDPAPVPTVPRARWCQGRLLFRSLMTEPGLMKVDALLFRNHFYRVMKVNTLCRTWACARCNHKFTRHNDCKVHQLGCDGALRRDYPETSYTSPKTVFQRLRDAGHEIDDPIHSHRVVYDWEAFFKKLLAQAGKMKHVARLEPLSVAVLSNFRGSNDFDQPKFICEPDCKTLVDQFYQTLVQISVEAGEDNAERYSDTLEFAYENARPYLDLLEELRNEEDEYKKEVLKNRLAAAKPGMETYQLLKKWLYQIPIIGFNSGKFDVNLIRTYLMPLLAANRQEDPVKGIIEKGSDFMSVSTERMIFLDVIHYLPPGVSLDDFNKCYGPPDYDGKYYWVYESITCYEDLLKPFPEDKSAFRSTLKNKDITDEEFEEARAFYHRHGCRNMLDFLRLYNIQDVGPFLISVENFIQIFRNLAGVDIFKHNLISLPGAAMRFMFSRQGDTIVPLFTKKYEDWHSRIKGNVVGGPAIVFTRKLEVGDYIRDTRNLCRKIIGVDANALYLFCIGQSMPTGIPRYYDLVHPNREVKEIPVMKPDEPISQDEIQSRIDHNMGAIMKQHVGYHSKHEIPYVLSAKRKLQALEDQKPPDVRKTLSVQHQFNGGQKWFLTQDGHNRIWVDGYIPELDLALEYCGCFHHGHGCPENLAQIQRCTNSDQYDRIRRKNFAHHEWRKRQLELAGVTVQEMWECEHPELHDADMKQAMSEVLPPLPLGLQTAKRLIERVSNDSFFGVLEVDIQVPYWNEALRQLMSEFPPLFKNVEISRADVGPYMNEYLVERNEVKQPRRSLISSYFATKKVLTTPLLKYYVSKGLVVTRVYGGVEYVPAKPFAFVTEEVTEHRKRADNARDNREAVARGNTAKLVGNSCYGKCLTNIEAHEDIRLMTAEKAAKAVNHRLFSKLDEVDEDHYLVHFKKSRVLHALPTLIAFFTYQMAKLKMIEFYYDFLLAHVGKEHFQLLQCDTDSMYMGISGNSFDEIATSPGYAEAKDQFLEGPNTKRVPGLFKPEWEGTHFIALNPKCYFGVNAEAKNKVSMKGVSHRTNSLTFAQYENVLYNRSEVPVEGPLTQVQAQNATPLPTMDLTRVPAVNKGFMRVQGKVTQYELHKSALSHIYLKRKLDADMVNTTPLDL